MGKVHKYTVDEFTANEFVVVEYVIANIASKKGLILEDFSA